MLKFPMMEKSLTELPATAMTNLYATNQPQFQAQSCLLLLLQLLHVFSIRNKHEAFFNIALLSARKELKYISERLNVTWWL